MGAKSKLACFDFETSGLDSKKNIVMEFAIVTSDQINFEPEVRYSELIKPYDVNGNSPIYEKKALEVHGISLAETESKGETKEKFVQNCIKLFKNLNMTRNKHWSARPILCGHNVVFDVSFLIQIFKECGEDLTKHVLSNNDQIVVWDSLQLSMQLHNNGSNDGFKYSLKDCFTREGFGEFMAHRALPDTEATLKLIGALINRMRGNSSKIKPNESISQEKSVGMEIRKSNRTKKEFFKF